MNLNVYTVIKRIRVQTESNALQDSMPEVGNRYLWLVIELSPRYLLRNANKKQRQRQRQRRRIEGCLTDLVVIKVKYREKMYERCHEKNHQNFNHNSHYYKSFIWV